MKRPWMPLYVAEYLADTGHLSAAEHGAYLLLIMHYWQKDGLPEDERQIARISRLMPAEWAESRDTLHALFGDCWRHKRIDAEIEHAEGIITKRRSAAETMHSKRAAKADANAPANASVLHEQMHTHAGVKVLVEEPNHLPPTVPEEAPSPREARKPEDWPDDYRERFWQAYPRKTGRKDGLKVLDRVARSSNAPSFVDLLAAVATIPRNASEVRFMPEASAWLNKERWNDEALPATGPPPLRVVNGPTIDQYGNPIHEQRSNAGARRPSFTDTIGAAMFAAERALER